MSPYYYHAVVCRVFATASALISGIVSLKLYGRYLGPEIYGVVLVALQIMNCLPLLDGGFRTTISRSVLAESDPVEKLRLIRFGQVFYTLLTCVIVVAALLLMAGYACMPNAKESGQTVGFFLTLGLVGALSVIGFAQMGLLVALGAQGSLFVLTGLNAWMLMAALWVSLHFGAGVWAFPISSLAGLVASYPAAWWLIRRRLPGLPVFSFRIDSDFWRYFDRLKTDAWACFRSQISIMLLFTLDVILVGILCSAKDAAIYGVLSRIYGIIRTFLQAAGEVSWPIVANDGGKRIGFMTVLLRLNGWTYGSVMGALSMVLVPFIDWFMGSDWTPPAWIVYLFTARFVITGVSSPAAYFLIGLGDFKVIARYIERELAAAVCLAIPAGMKFGATGIAASFLIATVFGTFLPILHAYAGKLNLKWTGLAFQVWWRTLLGFGASLSASWALLAAAGTGGRTVFVGMGAVIAALTFGLIISLVRWRIAGRGNLLNQTPNDILKNI